MRRDRSLLEVVAHNLGVLREPLPRLQLEPGAEALVQVRPQLLRDSVVGGVANEDVTEAERGLVLERRRGHLEKLLLDQGPKIVGDVSAVVRIRQLQHGASMEELTLDGSTFERRSTAGAEPVEACSEQRLDRVGNAEGTQIGGSRPGAVPAFEQTVVDEHGHELLDEERVPAGGGENPLADRPGYRTAEQVVDEPRGLGVLERLEANRRLPFGSGLEELRPREAEKHDWATGERRQPREDVE